jgi:hypothetical protein
MIGRRSIVEREEHARGGLKNEEEESHGAEDIDPAGSPGDRFIEEGPLNRLQIQATVEPIVEARRH